MSQTNPLKNKLFRLSIALLLLCASVSSTFSYADANKEREVGSAILSQEGDDPFCYKNAPYTYERIFEIENVKKDELFNRTKNWITGLKISNDDVKTDENEHNTIAVNFQLLIPNPNFRVAVHFKGLFSLKDNRVRFQGNQFNYVRIGYAVKESPLHDIRPESKILMKRFYTSFDKEFNSFLTSMEATITKDPNNW